VIAGDEVVGIVLPWIDEQENGRYDCNWGYTQGIFISKDWRNRGLACHLDDLLLV
jgi:hypothetical protein